jgi:hypothetical protein
MIQDDHMIEMRMDHTHIVFDDEDRNIVLALQVEQQPA